MLFDWISAAWGGLALDGIVVEDIDVVQRGEETAGIAESEFEMEFDEATSTLTLQYDATMYSDDRVIRMADAFKRTLAACAKQPGGPLPSSEHHTEWLATALPPQAKVRQMVESWQQRLRTELHDFEHSL